MDRITQEAYQRQRILKWAEKKSVTAAAIRYKVSRKTVYKWRKRYDGTPETLKDRSRAPHRIARKQTEEALIEMGIEYHRIQIATPRHNGKVERQHRTDELRFYKRMRMYCLEDGRKQLAAYQRRSNDHIMTCLGMRSPNEVLDLYRGIM